MRTRGATLVHHGGGTVPLVGPRPILLTVHDLQYRELPELFSATRLRYLRSMLPRSVARADVIATPTEFVRGTVIAAFGIDPDRIVVVPHGVPESPRPSDEAIASTRRRYGLDDAPYAVYPAITHPHKDHRVLLEALARPSVDPALRLVLLGGPGAAEQQVAAAIGALGLSSRVVRPGRVPDADRDALVAGAVALAFPSRYEGFGAPLIEAMALGTPVVCRDHPALREVAGDAAIVVGGDPDGWAEALSCVEQRRAGLVAAGHRRVAARFTQRASGLALAAAYRQVAG
jgi:alpha-1,3-rhamnosyl/mannosyltransferase